MLVVSLLLVAAASQPAAGGAGGSNATASDDPAAGSFLGPEWTTLDASLRSELRTLALRGLVPLGAISQHPVLRREAAHWFAPMANARGSPGPATEPGATDLPDSVHADTVESAPGSVSAARVARELAEELPTDAALPTAEAVTPYLDRQFGGPRLRLRPYAWFEGAWDGGEAFVWGDEPRVGVAGTLHLGPHLSLHQDVFAGRVEEARKFGDALVNHTDFVLFVENVQATYARRGGFLHVGRFRHAWGPGRFTNLLLAPSAQPFDQLEYGLDLGPFRYQALVGALASSLGKNVALHRLEWSPHPRWLLGVSEGAIYQGEVLQPVYLLGIVPYSIVDRIQAQDLFRSADPAPVRNNVLVQADVLVRAPAAVALWAEVLVDDVGTEHSDHPSRFGFLLGCERELLRGGGEWNYGVEAVKIYDYVYSVYYENSDWSHQERALGSSLGPDAESLRAFFRVRPTAEWEGSLDLVRERHGEGRLGRPWYPSDHPRAGENRGGRPSRLSGTVETASMARVGLAWAPSAGLRLGAWLALTRFEDRRNRSGADEEELSAQLSLRWHH